MKAGKDVLGRLLPLAANEHEGVALSVASARPSPLCAELQKGPAALSPTCSPGQERQPLAGSLGRWMDRPALHHSQLIGFRAQASRPPLLTCVLTVPLTVLASKQVCLGLLVFGGGPWGGGEGPVSPKGGVCRLRTWLLRCLPVFVSGSQNWGAESCSSWQPRGATLLIPCRTSISALSVQCWRC